MSLRKLIALATVACAAVAFLAYAPAAETAPGDLADLGVTKSDGPEPVAVGGTVTYTIVVTNAGPQNATGVTLTDGLPNHTNFVSATSSSGSCGRRGNRVVCEIGNLAADATKANAVTVTIQVRTTRTGTITNTASVDGVEKDPVAVNDKAEASTTVSASAAVPTCRGVKVTLLGTPRADNLVGTAGPDVISGLGGGDSIFGRSGRDLICAGGGADRVNAGSAADRVFGARGTDRIHGRGGPDLLMGNARRDALFGNAGNDRLKGGAGRDRCRGGPGRDRLRSCER
jgi:uncharacterized repeat protein (TIGR01451 family)